MVLPGICAAVQALNARMHALQQAGLSCKLCARPTMANAKCRDAPMPAGLDPGKHTSELDADMLCKCTGACRIWEAPAPAKQHCLLCEIKWHISHTTRHSLPKEALTVDAEVHMQRRGVICTYYLMSQ